MMVGWNCRSMKNNIEFPLISIIVPVYNQANNINRCMDSVVSQTYSNLEIIVVDDGSTDDSYKLCKEYETTYSNIFLYKKENAGVGSARNYGLSKITGKYILFVDSDDYLNSDCVKILYEKLVNNNSDICQCDFLYDHFGIIKSPKWKIEKSNLNYDSHSAIKNMWYGNELQIAPWGKLYKSELWETIRFAEVYYLEDYLTTYRVFLKASKITFVNEGLYYYVYQKKSQTNEFADFKLSGLDTAKIIIEDCEKNYIDLVGSAIAKGIDICFQVICQMNNVQDKYAVEYNKMKAFIKKYRIKCFFDFNVRKKTKAALFLSAVAGFRMVRVLYRSILWKK